MAELTLEQSINEIVPTLPPPVRSFLQKGRLAEVVQLIVDRYSLHIDHGAILEHHLILVLLGIEGPDDFTTELFSQLPISEQTVKDILNDLNTEVFAPIREEMRKGAEILAQARTMGPQQARPPMPRPPAPPQAPRAPSQTMQSVMQSTARPQVQMSRPMMQQPIRPPAPPKATRAPWETSQGAAQGAARPQTQMPRPVMQQPSRPAAQPEHYFHLENKIPPPPNPRRLLEDHEEPHIKISNTAPVANKSSFAPPNLPGRIEHPPLPTPPQPPAPKPIQPASPITPASPQPSPNATAGTAKATRAPWETSQGAAPTPPAPPKQYSSDPYREPLGP